MASQTALRLNPLDAENLCNLGAAQKLLGKFSASETSYRKAIELDPSLPKGHRGLGETLHATSKLHEALHSYQKYLELEPNSAEAHNNVGNIFYDQGLLQKAESSYLTALKIRPKFAEAANNLGLALFDLIRPLEAKSYFERSIEHRPDFAESHSNLGRARLSLGELESATSSCRTAIGLNPDFFQAHNNLGNSLLQLGRIEEAVESFSEALRINPNYIEARRNLSYARASLVPAWHIAMVNDHHRNQKYAQGIKKAVKENDLVLDIGAGSGLLSMIAADVGAGNILACESSKTIADTATRIIEKNGYKSQIKVVNKHSADLTLEHDLPQKVDLIISEILSAEFVGEGVRESIKDARIRLLKREGRMIPESGEVRIALLGKNKEISRLIQASESQGFDLSALNTIMQSKFDYQFVEKPNMFSDPASAFALNLYDDDFSRDLNITIPLETCKSGVCIGVIQWLKINVFDDIQYENFPGDNWSHWPTPVFLFDEPLNVKKGDTIKIDGFLGKDRLWFFNRKTNET